MSLTPTDEQSAIIHWQGQKLVVNAFAGTGKTSTLVQYALANPDSRMLYLAYNRSVRDEAERKFPFNVECKTSHQLAWSRFGKHYQKRLVASLRITDVARKLNTRRWLLVRLALSSLNQFLCSADPEGHRTVLSRTVAGVICTALMASLSGRKVYWVGGIEGQPLSLFSMKCVPEVSLVVERIYLKVKKYENSRC